MIRNGKNYIKSKYPNVYHIVEDDVYRYRRTFGNNSWSEEFSTAKSCYDAFVRERDSAKGDRTYANKDITFNDEWEHLQKRYSEKKKKDDATIRRYSSIYEHHLKEIFGDIKLQDIDPEKINNFLYEFYTVGDGKGKELNGYSYSYTESVLKFFWLVISESYRDKIISAELLNDFKETVKMPPKSKSKDNRKVRILNAEEIRAIDELLKDTKFYCAFLLSLLAGLRPAEVWGLDWGDINFKKKIINVNKQATIVDKELILKEPKCSSFTHGTSASYREIPMNDKLCEELKKFKALQDEERKNNPRVWEQNRGSITYGFNHERKVMPMPSLVMKDKNGKYISYGSFEYYAKQIRATICQSNHQVEDFSFYTFRKTFLSNMACSNISVFELAKIAGHKKTDTLLEYYFSQPEKTAEKIIRAQDNIYNFNPPEIEKIEIYF